MYHVFMNSPSRNQHPSWDFLTNHAHVLICVADDHPLEVLLGSARPTEEIPSDQGRLASS